MKVVREVRVSETLQSWKEIACYMKRGVRTVQRWESTSSLPVRRHGAGNRSPVFAFPSEIDHWMRTRRIGRVPEMQPQQTQSFHAAA